MEAPERDMRNSPSVFLLQTHREGGKERWKEREGEPEAALSLSLPLHSTIFKAPSFHSLYFIWPFCLLVLLSIKPLFRPPPPPPHQHVHFICGQRLKIFNAWEEKFGYEHFRWYKSGMCGTETTASNCFM